MARYAVLLPLLATLVAAAPTNDPVPQPTSGPIVPEARMQTQPVLPITSDERDLANTRGIEDLLRQYPQRRERPRANTVFLEVPKIVLNVPVSQPPKVEQHGIPDLLQAIKKASSEIDEESSLKVDLGRGKSRRGTAHPAGVKEVTGLKYEIKPRAGNGVDSEDEDVIQPRQAFKRGGVTSTKTLVDPKYGTMISPIFAAANRKGTGIFGKGLDDSQYSYMSLNEFLKTPRKRSESFKQPVDDEFYHFNKDGDAVVEVEEKDGPGLASLTNMVGQGSPLLKPATKRIPVPPRIPMELIPDHSPVAARDDRNPYGLAREECQNYLNTHFGIGEEFIAQTHKRMKIFDRVASDGLWPETDTITPGAVMGPGDLMMLLKEVMEYMPAINTYYTFLSRCHSVPLDQPDSFDLLNMYKGKPNTGSASRRMYLTVPSRLWPHFSAYLRRIVEEMDTFMAWLDRDIPIPSAVFQSEIVQWLQEISPYPNNWDDLWMLKLEENIASGITSVAKATRLVERMNSDTEPTVMAETYVVYYVQKRVLNICRQRLTWFTNVMEKISREAALARERANRPIPVTKPKGISCPGYAAKFCKALTSVFYKAKLPPPQRLESPLQSPSQMLNGDLESARVVQERPQSPEPLEDLDEQAGLTTSQYGSEVAEEYEEEDADYEGDEEDGVADDSELRIPSEALLRLAGSTPGPRIDGQAGFVRPQFRRDADRRNV